MSGKWWLVTWNTYGSWLPGDPRGFQTWRGREYVPPPRRYAKPGEATYHHEPYVDLHQMAREAMTGAPVRLTPDQQQEAVAAVIDEVVPTNVEPAVIAIGPVHNHLLARFDSPIRMAVGRLKAAASRRLHRCGLASDRIWSRNCHMRSKTTDREFRDAFGYVLDHRNEGATVYVWPAFQVPALIQADGMPSAWALPEEQR